MNVSAATVPQSTPAKAQGGQSPSPLAEFDQFLNLFVSQLKYQDPLSPVSGEDFLAQTAQFSTVEQLVSLNRKTGDVAGAMGVYSRATSAALIGRTVTALTVDGEGSGVEISGRVVRLDYSAQGDLTLGLEDGTAVSFVDVVSVTDS